MANDGNNTVSPHVHPKAQRGSTWRTDLSCCGGRVGSSFLTLNQHSVNIIKPLPQYTTVYS